MLTLTHRVTSLASFRLDLRRALAFLSTSASKRVAWAFSSASQTERVIVLPTRLGFVFLCVCRCLSSSIDYTKLSSVFSICFEGESVGGGGDVYSPLQTGELQCHSQCRYIDDACCLTLMEPDFKFYIEFSKEKPYRILKELKVKIDQMGIPSYGFHFERFNKKISKRYHHLDRLIPTCCPESHRRSGGAPAMPKPCRRLRLLPLRLPA